MSGSIRIARVAGIDLRLHWTFSLLIVGVFAFYLLAGETVAQAAFTLGVILALFVCVVLHELGHALMARHYNVPTQDITLYPIGGVARLQEIPSEPAKEFWISVAGPAVNLVIAGVLFAVLGLQGAIPPFEELMAPAAHFWPKMMWLNAVLVGFNLLPAFPMDGGRVLRALLATRMDYLKATQIAANVGQWMAMGFGFLGFLSFNPVLFFIALFVYLGAQQEARMTMMRVVVQGVPVREAMITDYVTLAAGDPLSVAVDRLLATSQQSFPVLEDGRLAGVLTRPALMKALAARGRHSADGEAMQASCPTVEDTSMLEKAFQQMQEASCRMVPVTRDGELVGILTLENVGELMMVNAALKGTRVKGALAEPAGA